MPVFDVGRRVLAATLRIFLERLATASGPHAARLGVDQLSAIVAVPRRPRAGFEFPAAGGDVLGVHRGHHADEIRTRRRLLGGDETGAANDQPAGKDQSYLHELHASPPLATGSLKA